MDDAPVTIHVTFDPRISFALQQNDVPVVKEVRLDHAGAEDLRDVTLRVTLGDGVAEPFERVLDRIPAGASMRLEDVRVVLDPARLREQTERESTRLVAELTGAVGGERVVLGRQVEPVDVLAFREWPGLRSVPELLAAYVLPVVRRGP